MIDREKVLRFIRKEANKPVSVEEIKTHFGLTEGQEEELQQILKALEEDGEIVKSRRGRYGLPERMNLLVGRLQGHPRGYGFVLAENGGDVYIPADKMNGAMHNDRVLVRVSYQLPGRKSREGEVVRVLKRANEQVVGTYSGTNRYGFVVPEEKRIWQDIFIPGRATKEARSGDLVVVAITQWPQDRRNPEGEIIEILGHKGDPGVDILGLMKKYQLEAEFPAPVKEEAERISMTVRPEEFYGRSDLRQLQVVTIDSEDAKDLDDAISIEVLPNSNYLLGVHIADVAHYVSEGSELDKEARARGCSVYLVDRVIPMLPPRLSNGICSLNAGEDRLALTVFIEVTGKGRVVSHEIKESVIRVSHRLSYNLVQRILVDKEEEACRRYHNLVPDLKVMARLCQVLKRRRQERGSIDFNFQERKVKLDERGRPLAVEVRERGLADEIVEEFMVLANEVIAEHLYWLNLPCIYRVHEKPDEEDIAFLRDFLHNLGYLLRGGKRTSPKDLQAVLREAKGKPDERLVSEVILRSLKRAHYHPDCLGHFGLAAKFYTHFTSPIRRYPDLIVHRVVKMMLRGKLDPNRLQTLAERLPALAQELSERERIAEEAELESVDLKVVEYMLDKEGQIFTGVISGVMPFGVFVELANGVEGLVHVSSMTDDYYHFLEEQLVLVGERLGRCYRIGDQVRVKVARVNLAERTIDFEFVD